MNGIIYVFSLNHTYRSSRAILVVREVRERMKDEHHDVARYEKPSRFPLCGYLPKDPRTKLAWRACVVLGGWGEEAMGASRRGWKRGVIDAHMQ